MAERRVEIRVSVDDADANKRLDALAAKLDRLTKRVWNVRLRLDDGGAAAKLDKMSAKLDKMSKQTITPRFNLKGITDANAQADKLNAKLDKLGHKRVTATVHIRTSGGSGIGRAGGLAGAAGGGAGSGVLSALGGANNSIFGGLIAALIGYATSIAPAIIPFGLGGLIGGGGALLAGKLGVTGTSKILADRQALAQARAALAGSKTGGSPLQHLTLRQDQAALARDQSKYGGFLPFGAAAHGLQSNLLGSLLTAVTGKSPGFSAGPHGQAGGSFLQGLTGILSQIGGFVKSIGPGLGNLFRASLPSLAAFVKIGEQFAKAVLPAMTQSLRALGPSLPTIVQGFKYLSQGIAGFIRNLGPGMKDAAIIFKGSMMVMKGVLQLVGAAASAFAIGIVKTSEFVRAVARNIPRYFDKMRHETAVIFDGIRHEIAHVWDQIFSNTIGRVIRLGHDVEAKFNSLRHDATAIFNGIRQMIASAWDTIWSNTIGRVSRGITTVTGWFRRLPGNIKSALSSLPGILYAIGKAILSSLLHGAESMLGSVLGFFSGLAGKIAGAVGNAVGSIGGLSGIASKVLHFANGGVIQEPIIGTGLRSGSTYTFGENGIHEAVTPLGSGGGGGTVNVYVSVNGDTNPDAAALRIAQLLRGYKTRHGNAALGIG